VSGTIQKCGAQAADTRRHTSTSQRIDTAICTGRNLIGLDQLELFAVLLAPADRLSRNEHDDNVTSCVASESSLQQPEKRRLPNGLESKFTQFTEIRRKSN
jgi:hypothetical protein